MRVVHCLIHNGSRGYRLPDADRTWEDLREFVGRQTRDFVYPIPSSLYLECKREIEARHQEEVRNDVASASQLTLGNGTLNL